MVAVGSIGNIAEDPAPHATVQVFDADGSNPRALASGLRNPIGLAAHPGQTDVRIWVADRLTHGHSSIGCGEGSQRAYRLPGDHSALVDGDNQHFDLRVPSGNVCHLSGTWRYGLVEHLVYLDAHV